MNKNDITIDLNKLTVCQKQELKDWLNEISSFTDWSIRMLNKNICHYLDFEPLASWKITDRIRPEKKEITYDEFREFIQQSI